MRRWVVVWVGGGPAIFAIAAAVVARRSAGRRDLLLAHPPRHPLARCWRKVLLTFGLAFLLRYTAHVLDFSTNFVSLPPNAMSGTINLAGILYMNPPQLVAGLVAITLTVSAATFCSPAPRSAASQWPSPKTARRRC